MLGKARRRKEGGEEGFLGAVEADGGVYRGWSTNQACATGIRAKSKGVICDVGGFTWRQGTFFAFRAGGFGWCWQRLVCA